LRVGAQDNLAGVSRPRPAEQRREIDLDDIRRVLPDRLAQVCDIADGLLHDSVRISHRLRIL
jgi:hypothetical protein